MAAYPGAVPSLTRPTFGQSANDGSATDATVVIDAISDEIEAIATELGTNPSGASPTVAAAISRLHAVTPEDYGAASAYSAAVDDTAYVQAAVDGAIAAGKMLRLNRTYNIDSGPVTIASPLEVHGVGSIWGGNPGVRPSQKSGLRTSRPTGDVLLITSHGVSLSQFAVVNVSSTDPTSGAGIHVTTGGGRATFDRLAVLGFYDNIVYEAGTYYTMRGCHSYDPVRYGIYIKSTLAAVDSGDMLLDGCFIDVIYTTRNPVAAVRWEGGGGLKFVSGKVNGHASTGTFAVGVDVQIMDGGATSDIFITGSSIENITEAGIKITDLGPSKTGTLANIQITGNEIGAGTRTYGIYINAFAGGAYRQITITGNTIIGCTDTGIYMLNAWYAAVAGNVITMTGTSGHSGIQVNGNGLTIGENTVYLPPGSTLSSGALTINGTASSNVNVTPPNFIGTSGALVVDNRWNSGATNVSHGSLNYDMTRTIQSTTSTSTWTRLFTIAMPTTGGGAFALDLRITGVAVGVGPFAIAASRLVQQATTGAACTVTTVGTDVATLAGQVDYQFDTATLTGQVIVAVKLNAAATATNLSGAARLSTSGTVYQFIRNS